MWDLDHKESWAPNNWCFWTVVLDKTLENPLDCKTSNQSILKEINPEYSLEALMLKLKLQYFGHPDAKNWLIKKRPWCWERLKAGGEGDDRGWDCWMTSRTRWTWVRASSGSWWWTEKPGLLQSVGSQRVSHDWVTELTDWLYQIFFLLEYNCFTMLCSFLLYNKVNQLYVYIHPLPPDPFFHPATPILSL